MRNLYPLIFVSFFFIASIALAQSNTPEFGKEHDALIVSILERLESKDQITQIEASQSLLKVANNGDLPILVKTLRKGNDQPKQIAIVKALAKIGDPRAAEVLRFEIEHGKGEAVLEAITALGQLGTNWAIPLLVNQFLTKDSRGGVVDTEKTIRALVAIAKIGTPRSLDTLKSIGTKIDPKYYDILTWLIKQREGKLEYEKYDGELPRSRGLNFEFEGAGASFFYPSQYADAPDRPWLLVCIPDVNFDVETLFRQCQKEARTRGMAVLVPHFHPMLFLHYQNFNIGGKRSDKYLLDLLAYVQKHAEIQSNEIYLYGKNAGGSFVERFVLTNPRRVARAVALNSEIVALDADVLFPNGVRRSPLAGDIEINLYDYIKSDIYLYPGEGVSKKRVEKFESLLEEFKFQQGVLPRIVLSRARTPSFEDAMSILFSRAVVE